MPSVIHFSDPAPDPVEDRPALSRAIIVANRGAGPRADGIVITPSHNPPRDGGFKCSVCGYIHESETLRDDFICPICRATADKFVRQK